MIFPDPASLRKGGLVDKRVLNSLTELERNLVAETEKEAMAELEEDALLALHDRIRRARTKYAKLYRREASAKVSEYAGRGKAYPKNQRNRDKAEIFELALARASRRVEVVAKKAAAELREERLAAARGDKPVRATEGSGLKQAEKAVRRPRATKTAGGLKKDASTQSMGARRQAKRDSR
jgi:hypothetical protein